MARITDEQLSECKDYMRVDISDDDELIKALMEAAVDYLGSAGARESWTKRYALAVWSLTLYYYDHRDAVGTEAPMPAGLRPILNQLKLDGSVVRATEAKDDD